MSAENPDLEVAWRFRNLTPEQRAAMDREFQELEVLYHRAQQASDDPRKAQAMAQMEAKGREIGLVLTAGKILNNARRDVVKRAEKVKPAIDSYQTELRQEIAGIMRGVGGKVAPQAPTNYGKLSGAEGRRKVMEEFGFDPGWGH